MWEKEGRKGDNRGRKEEEMMAAVSECGRDVREIQRVRKSNKNR